jgi:sulfur-oxidizing protein SoxY
MQLSRREAVLGSLWAVAFAAAGFPVTRAMAEAETVEDAIAAFTGGVTPETGRVTLTVPEVAENGNIVPVSFAVDAGTNGDQRVEAVALLADDNPQPHVALFTFSPLSAEAAVTTRMRLARTQNVIAVARLADGSYFMDMKAVTVTVGGCGA